MLVCVYVYAPFLHGTYEIKKTTLRSLFSSFIKYDLEIKLGPSGFYGKSFYQLSHLESPEIIHFIWLFNS